MVISVLGVLSVTGTRVGNEKSVLTPWLLLGALPVVVVLWAFHLLR